MSNEKTPDTGRDKRSWFTRWWAIGAAGVIVGVAIGAPIGASADTTATPQAAVQEQQDSKKIDTLQRKLDDAETELVDTRDALDDAETHISECQTDLHDTAEAGGIAMTQFQRTITLLQKLNAGGLINNADAATMKDIGQKINEAQDLIPTSTQC